MEDDTNEPRHTEDGVGYQRPPRNTRFVKGKSGNPAGRPPGRHKQAPYEAVLGQMVTIREGKTMRRVTAAEAFLLQLAKRGVEGNSVASRASLALIEQAKSRQIAEEPVSFIFVSVAPGSVNSALLTLGMATKLDPCRETARMVLEPWLVEAALAHLPQPLSPAEQRIVVKDTHTPHKVRWPEWWNEFP